MALHHGSIEREERDFYQRARLDKQNMIPSFEWTGEALFDIANARIRACAQSGASPKLADLFEPGVTQGRLIDAGHIPMQFRCNAIQQVAHQQPDISAARTQRGHR